MILMLGFVGVVLGGVLYGGADGHGWESFGKGAAGGAVIGLLIGVVAVLRGA